METFRILPLFKGHSSLDWKKKVMLHKTVEMWKLLFVQNQLAPVLPKHMNFWAEQG